MDGLFWDVVGCYAFTLCLSVVRVACVIVCCIPVNSVGHYVWVYVVCRFSLVSWFKVVGLLWYLVCICDGLWFLLIAYTAQFIASRGVLVLVAVVFGLVCRVDTLLVLWLCGLVYWLCWF